MNSATKPIPVSEETKNRGAKWVAGLKAEMLKRNCAKTQKSLCGIPVGSFELVQVAELRDGDTIKLRLSNRSSSVNSRLWTLVAISPQGIRADLFLRCPKSGESPTVTLRLDHQVFRGVRK
jgi:hypothetical protein